MKKKSIYCIIIFFIFLFMMNLSGCTTKKGTKIYQINELLDKADVNEKVIVEGRWFEWGDIQKIISEKGHLHVLITDNVNMTDIEEETTYLFTGFLRYGKLPGYTQNLLYLEITDYEKKE